MASDGSILVPTNAEIGCNRSEGPRVSILAETLDILISPVTDLKDSDIRS